MRIVDNRKAFHDYDIQDRYEAGMVLAGWEVKAIRAGRGHIKQAYVILRNEEVFLLGAHITALNSASTHVEVDPLRTRKLLLHRAEIKKLIGKVERAGYTLIPLNLHYQRGRIKCEIALAKGKKQFDKRASDKARDADRQAQQAMKYR